MIFTPKQTHALKTWIATASGLEGVFFRSVERRYMDPDDVLSGEGAASKGGRFAAKGMRAVYLSATDSGASKETTERKKRLGGGALINTAKYPRIVYAVAVKLDRVLRLDGLASSTEGDAIQELCLDEDDLAASMEVATMVEFAGIQGLVFPSVVKGGDDNLVVFCKNYAPNAVRIENEADFIAETKKIASKRK